MRSLLSFYMEDDDFREFAKDNFPSHGPEFLYILTSGISMLGCQVRVLHNHLENKSDSTQLLKHASEGKLIREIMEQVEAESEPKIQGKKG
ncbi:hypothetical protein ACFX19_033945 [Malus domestica]